MKKILSIITAITLAVTALASPTDALAQGKKTQVSKKTKKLTPKVSKRKVSKKSYIPSLHGIKYAVFNYESGDVYESNSIDTIWPIASLTKLMTAQIFIKNHPNLNNCETTITDLDIDRIKGTSTKLGMYKTYSCKNLLEVMLVASDNYAAHALSRSIPGWTRDKFVYEMNKQAKEWNLENTSFVDPSGLSPLNRSSVFDYKNLTMKVVKNPIISGISTSQYVYAENKWNKEIEFGNSNRLIRYNNYETELSKTGHIKESGYNLVHLADCKKNIGVIEFGARSSDQRSSFVRNKLLKYGCAS